MDPEERCRLLAEKISAILQNGWSLSKNTVHFIDSTFPNASIEALKEMVHDVENGEAESLFSLIFFPDAAVQIQLEDILENEDYQKADEKRVFNRLVDMLPETPIRFPDNRGTLYLAMPESVVDPFISRLKISKKLDGKLAEGIRRHVAEDLKTHIKVKLRNSRYAETEDRVSFLCTFFEKANDNGDQGLDFILDLFETENVNRDVYAAFIERKRFYFQNLQKAKRYQELLNTDNMETLMLRGVRIPYIDQADMSHKMNIIDEICLAVYGKTEYFQPPEQIEKSELKFEVPKL